MFGYIRPNHLELKLKDIRRYSGYYCALCDQLGRDYGFSGRFVLSYDVTFLFLCLNTLVSPGRESRKIRCPYYFWRMKTVSVAPEALKYAAFINYWLAVQKLRDDSRDDRAFWKSWAGKLLVSKRRYRTVESEYRRQAEELAALLSHVYEKERQLNTETDFDAATNSFGTFFAELFQMPCSGSAQEGALAQLGRLAFHLGKWIYIMDAFDDLDRDRKRRSGNLLAALNGGILPEKEDAFDMVFTLHLQIRHKINRLLHSAAVQPEDDCILNIMTDGIDAVFYKITRKKYREFAERVEHFGDFSVEQLAAKSR